MGLICSVNTPPIACPLAFLVMVNVLAKFGKARIEALLRVFFINLKASSTNKVQPNTLSFFREALIGEAICAYD